MTTEAQTLAQLAAAAYRKVVLEIESLPLWTGSRAVMAYLLSPSQRVGAETARER